MKLQTTCWTLFIIGVILTFASKGTEILGIYLQGIAVGLALSTWFTNENKEKNDEKDN